MSLIVSSMAASLLNVPGTAVSPCSTVSRVTWPDIGAKIVVLSSELLRRSSRRDRPGRRACLAASTSALFTSTAVLSCSSCSSDDERARFCLLDLGRAIVAASCACSRLRLGLRELRAARRERRLRALDGGLRLRRVDLEQELAGLHHLAFLDGELDDLAADVGRDVDLGLRPHLAARRDRRDQVALLHRLDADFDRLVAALGGAERDRRRRARPAARRRSRSSISCP